MDKCKIITGAVISLALTLCMSSAASADAVYDSETSTLTLSGKVEINASEGVVLPAGVVKTDVERVVCENAKFENCDYAFSDFSNCTSMDLRSCDTSAVTSMKAMFIKCSKVTVLDLSSFDMRSVKNVNLMFKNCSELHTIYVGSQNCDWTEITNGSDMFTNCNNLEGGDTTKFINVKNTGKAYAKVDGGEDDMGYFTLKVPEYTVTFETNGGRAVDPVTAAAGQTIGEPDTARKGYTFEGWYTDKSFSEEFDFTTGIASDITLYAKWSMEAPGEFVVKYMWDGDDCTAYVYDKDEGELLAAVHLEAEGDKWTGEYNGCDIAVEKPSGTRNDASVKRTSNGDGSSDKAVITYRAALDKESGDYLTALKIDVSLSNGREASYTKDVRAYSSSMVLTLKIPSDTSLEYTCSYVTKRGNTVSEVNGTSGTLEG
ncbi:MAG: InlB B-repeat-containing protein, partial [Oscillospiraceae bacterium]|nr:InlB B-repeat-containing protein [Oscillospiraceae bacterium]